jgi:phenylacetate-coenzyme A ligase PaaK-like adenylate-forming protein
MTTTTSRPDRRDNSEPSVPADTTVPAPLSADVVAGLLTRMTGLPMLRDRYAGLRHFADFPVLTKDDFRAVLEETIRGARRRRTGSLVLGSGGTTAAPKLSLIPSGMFVTDLRRHWDPMDAGDVLINYDTPGRLCSSHNFFNRLAHESGAVAVPLGAVDDEELGQWLDFAEHVGATALNATQTHIAHILGFCAANGRTPPPFRKLLWTGEAFGAQALELSRRMLPHAELYGVYGSTETWVIGHNGPGCRLDIFHVLPYQYVEIVDGQLLITTLHPDVINPIVRYRVGDRGAFVRCPCGGPGPAVHVLGRDDPQFKFLSILVSPQEIAGAAHRAEVRDLQVALIDHGTRHERAELRVLIAEQANAAQVEREVREQVLRQVYRLGYEVASAPDAFRVRVVERLATNPRSQKTPLLVKEEGHA